MSVPKTNLEKLCVIPSLPCVLSAFLRERVWNVLCRVFHSLASVQQDLQRCRQRQAEGVWLAGAVPRDMSPQVGFVRGLG